MRIVSWNVNGIRAIAKKDFFSDLKAMRPDVLCLQETKAGEDEVRSVLGELDGYIVHANSSKARKGYSGTAVISREEPVDVLFDMAIRAHDQEGRIVAAEYKDFFVLSVYTPNSGEGLARLEYRQEWDQDFRKHVQWLERRKPVIICGDLNVAHEPIDIARPKENYNKSAGYTQHEIDGFKRLLDAGYIDTWRHQHPDEVKYSYWNYWLSAREKNIGWRIDYVLVSNRLLPKVQQSMIFNEHFGSDHCPVGIDIDLK